QVLYDLALGNVDQVHAVAAADRHAGEAAVRRDGALVGQPGQLDRLHDPVRGRVDDAEGVVALDGGEEAPAVGGGRGPVRVVGRLDLADDLEGAQVDNVDIVAGAVGDVQLRHRLRRRGGAAAQHGQDDPD